jgi:tRNA (guanine-N7-)-methyltransferase
MDRALSQRNVAGRRVFPLEWESRKPILFYPDQVEQVTGDILEIGPGRGDLLLWLAATHPDKKLIGIELMFRRYRKLIARIERKGLTNVNLLRGNARVIVPRYVAESAFERIYVLFPDPWPKQRHTHHRLLSVEFLTQLTARLKPSGDIVFATDWQPYADWVIANAAHVPQLQNTGTPYSTENNLNPSGERTFFENLWQQKGRNIYYVRLQMNHAAID